MRLARAGHIFDRILDIAATVAAVMCAFIMLAVGVEIFTRYFLGESLTWVIDISSMLLLYITLLAAGWLLREDGHIRIDMVTDRLNPGHRRLLSIITAIISSLIFATIVWYGVKSTWYFYSIGYWMAVSLETPKYLVIIVIPVGACMLFIQSLRNIYRLLKSNSIPSQ